MSLTAHLEDRRGGGSGRQLFGTIVKLDVPDFHGCLLEAESVEVGPKGLSLRAAYQPPVGQRMQCRFDTPEGMPITASCEVRWNERDGEQDCRFGVEFMDMDTRSHIMLRGLLGEDEGDAVMGAAASPDRRAGAGVDASDATGDGACRGAVEAASLNDSPGRLERTPATLRLAGMAAPIEVQLTDAGGDLVLVEQDMEVFRPGRTVELSGPGADSIDGRIASVQLAHLDDGTPVLQLGLLKDVPVEASAEPDDVRGSEEDEDEGLELTGMLEDVTGLQASQPQGPAMPASSGGWRELDEPDLCPPVHTVAGGPVSHRVERLEDSSVEGGVASSGEPQLEGAEDESVGLWSASLRRLAGWRQWTHFLRSLGILLSRHPLVIALAERFDALRLRLRPASQQPDSNLSVSAAVDEGPSESPQASGCSPSPAGDDLGDAQESFEESDARGASDPVMRAETHALPDPESAEDVAPESADASAVRAALATFTESLSSAYSSASERASGTLRVLGQVRSRLQEREPRRRTGAAGRRAERDEQQRAARRGVLMRRLVLGAGVFVAGVLAVFALGGDPEPAEPGYHRALGKSAVPSTGDSAGALGTKPADSDSATPSGTPGKKVKGSADEFSHGELGRALTYPLTMDGKVELLEGERLSNGFRVRAYGAQTVDTARYIQRMDPSVARAEFLNFGSYAELTVRFAPGKGRAFRVKAEGRELTVSIASS